METNELIFYKLFHAFIRTSSSEEEKARTARVFAWLSDNMNAVSNLCESDQKNLFGVLWDHWIKFNSAPSRTVLESMIRERDKPDAMLDILREYDEYVKNNALGVLDDLDMPATLEALKADWDKAILSAILAKALAINKGRMAGARPTDPPLSGPQDAINYIASKVDAGLVGAIPTPVGRSFRKSAGSFEDSYTLAQRGLSDVIPTLEPIDEVTRGIRRGHMWGILGYAAARKSAICRNIAYNAAIAGRTVLYIPLESDPKEELVIYTVMHAKTIFPGAEVPSIVDTQSGLLRPDQLDLLARADADLARIRGDVIVKTPVDTNWASIKALIYTQNQATPLDLVIIDYLTMVDVAGERDQVGAMNAVIKDFKRLCMAFDGGRGLAGLTPIQGNREGLKRATEAGGVWSKEGVNQYSEFDKSLDVMAYVFTDPELQAAGQLKVGTCKSRRSADAPVTTVAIDSASGLITTYEPYSNLVSISDLTNNKEDWFG